MVPRAARAPDGRATPEVALQVALTVTLILAAAGATATEGVVAEARPATSAEVPASPTARPGPTGLARFTARPRYDGASISPKGSSLALVATEGGERRLVFIDLATRKITSTVEPGKDTMVGRFLWATDRRVVEPSEGHGFYGEAVQERTYRRVVEFLKANTRAEAAPSAAPR